jgi:hypothetical protein
MSETYLTNTPVGLDEPIWCLHAFSYRQTQRPGFVYAHLQSWHIWSHQGCPNVYAHDICKPSLLLVTDFAHSARVTGMFLQHGGVVDMRPIIHGSAMLLLAGLPPVSSIICGSWSNLHAHHTLCNFWQGVRVVARSYG